VYQSNTAINLIDPQEQAYVRQTVAHKLQALINKERTQQENRTQGTKQESLEKKHIINIRNKIKQNNLVITKADKDNTLLIIHKNEYCQKIDDFITQNNFTKIEIIIPRNNKMLLKQQ
jgi:hypothetical protein